MDGGKWQKGGSLAYNPAGTFRHSVHSFGHPSARPIGLGGADDTCAPARFLAGRDLPEVPLQHLRLCDGFSACSVVGVRRALYLFPKSAVQSVEGTVRWERNYFDRVGHFAQGFVPAFLAKEFLLRGGYVKKGKMLTLIVILCCLGFSAAYELSEFAVVKIMDVPADAVMGTQGDAFDSLWDMIWALIGASLAVFVLGSFHDKHMEKMGGGKRHPDW